MAENKTKPTMDSVTAFLNKIPDQQVREDCFTILAMMQKVTNYEPIMWGNAMIGFGSYHYVMKADGKAISSDRFFTQKTEYQHLFVVRFEKSGGRTFQPGQVHNRQGLPLYQIAQCGGPAGSRASLCQGVSGSPG